MILLSIALALISCININAATEEELEKIEHIGPARAGQIVKLREEKFFSSLDELDRVRGIGPARIADIKKQELACASLRQELPLAEAPSAEVRPPSVEVEPQSVRLLPTASIVAIFSGFAILFLKRKLRALCQDTLTPKQ